MSAEEKWLKTSDAAHHLGVSQWYLKQCRDCYEDGFLIEREHYILGASRTAVSYTHLTLPTNREV